MAMTDNLIDLRYRASNGIIDVYTPRGPSGRRRERSLARFDEYLQQTIEWCRLNKTEGSAVDHRDYRILDTFLGSLSDVVLEQLISRAISSPSKLRILLLDPLSPQGATRSHSLSGSTHSRSERALLRLHDALARATDKKIVYFDMNVTPLRHVVSSIRAMAPDDVELKFHSEITSGISYFFEDVLIRGMTFAGRSAQEGFWDRIVNDPARGDDRYDLYSIEFEETWEHRSYKDPGDQTGDPNGVFISYRHENAAFAKRIHDHLVGPHYVDESMKQLHVDLGEKEAQDAVGLDVFLDQNDLQLGDWWKEVIRSTLNDKGTIIVLIDATGMSEWMLLEAGHFWSTNKQVIPILLDPDEQFVEQAAAKKALGGEWLPPMPSALRDAQYTTWDGEDQRVLDELRDGILRKARSHEPADL